jgi:serine protease Do
VSQDGNILTNNHVVNGATEIKVSLPDKRELDAKVIGTDPKTDVAVLKINAKDLPTLTLGDSSKMRVGDFAIAVGNPFGVGETVTMGIISATGRGGLGIEDYEDFIQTDAAVNPGNSGGALVNVHGELIGINTAILSGGGGSEGVGFAVPANMARDVMNQIVKSGKVTRGWLGVTVQPLTPSMAKAFGLNTDVRGALIADVAPDSPAAGSGLKKGDIILALNGQAVDDSRALSLKISQMAPGTAITLKVASEGKQRDVSAKLGEMPTPTASSGENGGNENGPRIGVSVEPLTPQLSQQLGLPSSTTGVVVTDVDPGSTAAEAGLHRGDVIEEVNHKTITNVDQFQNAIRQVDTQQLLLLIDRGGGHLYVVLEPDRTLGAK